MDQINLEIYSPFDALTKNFDNDVDWESFSARLSALPQSTQNIIFDTSTMEFFMDLAETYSLDANQSELLSKITGNTILGNIFVGDMMNEIAQKLGLNQRVAQQVRIQIINELFAPAIEDIKKIQKEKFPNRISSQNQTPQSAIPQRPSIFRPPNINENNIIDLRNQNK